MLQSCMLSLQTQVSHASEHRLGQVLLLLVLLPGALRFDTLCWAACLQYNTLVATISGSRLSLP